MIKKLLLLFGGFLSSACSAPAPVQSILEIEPHYQLETLRQGTVTTDRMLQVAVTSTGCTSEKDFKVYAEAVEGQCQISVYRIQPDRCRRAPQALALELGIPQIPACEGLPVVLMNTVNGDSTAPESRSPLVNR